MKALTEVSQESHKQTKATKSKGTITANPEGVWGRGGWFLDYHIILSKVSSFQQKFNKTHKETGKYSTYTICISILLILHIYVGKKVLNRNSLERFQIYIY